MENKVQVLPEVVMICLDCTEGEVAAIRERTLYPNLKIESVSLHTQGLHGVFGIILQTEAPYICFAESGRISSPDKISKMVKFMEGIKGIGSALCRNEYIDEKGQHVSWMIRMWSRYLEGMGKAVNGKGFLELCLLKEDNMYGNLDCCMLRREIFINKDFLLNYIDCSKEEEKMLLMFECLYGMGVGLLHEELVQSVEQEISIEQTYECNRHYHSLRDKILKGVYKQTIYATRELPSFYRVCEEGLDRRSLVEKVEKEITFFHAGQVEYYNLKPLAEEAERRGWRVKITTDLGEKTEVGVYCSHVGQMQRADFSAKLSVILLHDMTQGELDWPDLWNEEAWDLFDIGILPGREWSKRWKECSGFYYAHPKLGVYEAGYPKGDMINSEALTKRSEEIRNELNMKYEYTVLYVPSWENDGKEHDFVSAICDLPVNLLIKQGAWTVGALAENVKRMREVHESYENVYYVNPRENIMNIYPLCDLVVSDESGAMTEALLFGKPSIAVMDWTIPDENPPRLASVPFDYVYKCKKAQLREQVEIVLDNIKNHSETMGTEPFFSHVGETNSVIMDLIEYYIGESDKDECLSTELCPERRLHGMWD